MSHMTHEQWKIAFHFSQEKFIKLTKLMQKWGNLMDKQQSWREFQSNPSRYFPIHINKGGTPWRFCSSWAEGWMWIHRPTQGSLLQTSVDLPCPLQPQAPAHALQPAPGLWVCSCNLNVLALSGSKAPHQSLLSSFSVPWLLCYMMDQLL